MTTTTDLNSMLFHSSSRINDEISNSFMDIDDIQVSTISNGHLSPTHEIQNGNQG
jgi:hypothetical protein